MNDQGVLITDYRVQRKESPEQCLGGVCVCNAKGRVQFWKVSQRIQTWDVERRKNEQKEIVLLD